MRFVIPFLMLGSLYSVAGCGGTATPPPDDRPKYSGTADLKQKLQEIAKSGYGGSALGGIEESLEELKKTDAPKAEKLLSEFKKLDAAVTADQRKQIAQQMADQL